MAWYQSSYIYRNVQQRKNASNFEDIVRWIKSTNIFLIQFAEINFISTILKRKIQKKL